MFWFCFFRAFALFFHFKLWAALLLVEAQKYFFPQVQGTLATPLMPCYIAFFFIIYIDVVNES